MLRITPYLFLPFPFSFMNFGPHLVCLGCPELSSATCRASTEKPALSPASTYLFLFSKTILLLLFVLRVAYAGTQWLLPGVVVILGCLGWNLVSTPHPEPAQGPTSCSSWGLSLRILLNSALFGVASPTTGLDMLQLSALSVTKNAIGSSGRGLLKVLGQLGLE